MRRKTFFIFFTLALYPIFDYAQEQDLGKSTYEHYCIVCHQDGVAGAPKFKNEEDWKGRMSGKKIDDLVNSAIKGLNNMPAQGTCTECTKDDLKAAIEYMIPKL